jgi:predicted amidophosphoribosyltransferase
MTDPTHLCSSCHSEPVASRGLQCSECGDPKPQRCAQCGEVLGEPGIYCGDRCETASAAEFYAEALMDQERVDGSQP